MKTILLIGLGGGLGSILRYLVQLGTSKLLTVAFPTGTFLVNITGCFLIGVLYGIFEKSQMPGTEWRLLLITGLCGGYTTFSTFSIESILLFRQGYYTYFILYVLLSVLLGLLAVVAGLSVVK